MIKYLAAPYSHPDPRVREHRHDQATFVCAELIRRGEIIFSPITHCHFMAKGHRLPNDADYWLRYCLVFLRKSSKLYVLQLPGWKESKGVQAEIKFATSRNIPIEYITIEDFSGKDNQHTDS